LEELISNPSEYRVNLMGKDYWEKQMKKELQDEQSKLEEEITEAVKKKLDKIKESES
jgi:hypothetical protein